MILKKYIITAHNNPEQLLRLINKLNDEMSYFYIHIDLKVDISLFKKCIKKNVYLINDRVDCIWGDFSQVVATINLLKFAVKNQINFENSRIIFLSGSDYLIKNISELNNYLIENRDYEFISYQFEDKLIPENHPNYIDRVSKYKYNFSSKRGDFFLTKGFIYENLKGKKALIKYLVTGKISFSFFVKSLAKRKKIFNENCKGANWFALNEKTIKNILNYIALNEHELYDYYKYTLCPDEQFFHTIINELMKNNYDIILNDYLHYIDWSRKNVDLPVTFTKNDIHLLMCQPKNKFFARKFDTKIDADILDMIDRNISKQYPVN